MSKEANHQLSAELEGQLREQFEKIEDIEHECQHEREALDAKYFVKKGEHFKKLSTIFNQIEGFYPTALRNASVFIDINAPEISDIIGSITNISVDYKEGKTTHGTLTFEFKDNDYFKNKKIVRDLTIVEDEADGHAHARLVIKATKIDWKDGKEIEVGEEGTGFIDWIVQEESPDIDEFILKEFYPSIYDFYLGVEEQGEMYDEDSDDDLDDEEEEEEEDEPDFKKAKV